jgi:SpoVK/Ycf46/Vps4 family AAA+-type ATPase
MVLFCLFLLCGLIVAQDYAPFKCDLKQMTEYENTLQLRAINASLLVGYTEVRRELEQILVGPIQFPNEYSGLLGGGRGVLLFGPPGTGKVRLVSCLFIFFFFTFILFGLL